MVVRIRLGFRLGFRLSSEVQVAELGVDIRLGAVEDDVAVVLAAADNLADRGVEAALDRTG